MISLLVSHTNTEIDQRARKFSSKQWYIGHTDPLEIRAMMGVLFMSAVLKDSALKIRDMFSPQYGPPFFRCSMSKNRFEFLLGSLRFDDKATRDQRKTNEIFATFREFWNLFADNCKCNYTLSEYMTIDETLLSFKGRCPFKTYIPNKHDKYGLKIISMCDARTFYFLDGIPYIGRQTLQRKSFKDFSTPTQYVLELTKPFFKTHRNITMDNWFASCELADELAENGLTMVGTLRKNKREIPPLL